MKKLVSKFLSLFFIVSCQRYSELSSHYLDRKLSLRERITFNIHHFHCTFCRRFFKQIKSLDTVAKSSFFKEHLPNHKMPNCCKQKIMAKIDEEVSKTQ